MACHQGGMVYPSTQVAANDMTVNDGYRVRVDDTPTYLRPFVLPTPDVARERTGNVDLYLPEADTPRPAVLFVHGGPIAEDQEPTPRDWPVYVGYGATAAARGLVGVTLDHRFRSAGDLPTAAADVADAVDLVRRDERVDPDRVGLWFFSGGGLLLGDWLRTPPPWLRVVAATYPLLGAAPEWGVDARFQPIDALAGVGSLPIVLTRVGLERPALAAMVEAFVRAAGDRGARLRLIDVPNGQHGFDHLDHTDESREAVTAAVMAVHEHLLDQAIQMS
jgi:acetyl esterase/lipase